MQKDHLFFFFFSKSTIKIFFRAEQFDHQVKLKTFKATFHSPKPSRRFSKTLWWKWHYFHQIRSGNCETRILKTYLLKVNLPLVWRAVQPILQSSYKLTFIASLNLSFGLRLDSSIFSSFFKTIWMSWKKKETVSNQRKAILKRFFLCKFPDMPELVISSHNDHLIQFLNFLISYILIGRYNEWQAYKSHWKFASSFKTYATFQIKQCTCRVSHVFYMVIFSQW